MDRIHRQQVAKQNREHIIINKIKFPRSIKVKYGDVPIIKAPIIDGLLTNSKVSFHLMKSDECAIYYLTHGLGKNVCIMNFANRFHHGGGYLSGARAQEEDLCRVIPELYESLYTVKYPFEATSVIITPPIWIVRDSKDYTFFPNRSGYKVSIVSAAAQNLKYEQYDEKLVIQILENMYCAVKTLLPETDTLILGAWGCGAFGNDPEQMAKIMNQINLQYGGYFANIVFSIPPGINVTEFKKSITLV
jgi:uncharacterized protein (TIGR02452 family)